MTDVTFLLVLAIVAGVLSLDETAAFQVMLSQPLVAAFVAGPVIRNTSAAPGDTPAWMKAAASGTDAVAHT